VDCVCELIGNPSFKNIMQFAPEMVFSDAEGKNQVYDKMWTDEWWWNV
jgi:hypothetical protein